MHNDFVAALTEQAKNTRTGMPDDKDVLYGALNNENQLSRVTDMVGRLGGGRGVPGARPAR